MTDQTHISGGKGVIVGDYATVFQTFADGTRPLSASVRSQQFRTLVDDRVKGFVGRDFVFDAVARAVSGATADRGYVMIRGEPGIGKTAVAANLVMRHQWVHHFNIAPENIRSPRQFLENVCAQLILTYGLEHAALPPDAGSDAGFLAQLLAESADRAGERDELPVVVVVDALDEADDTGLAPSANRLYLPRTLPPGVFFVVTAREEADYRLDIGDPVEIWIRDDDPANAADVRRYVEAFVADNREVMGERSREWGVDRDALVSELVELSEGNFMYLVHVLPDIARGRLRRETVGDVAHLPRGLKGYYQRHWRAMKAADEARFTEQQRPVLCLLAVSREPVTAREVADWAGLEPGAVRAVLSEWREFLNEDDASAPRYRLYHRSFADFLDTQEDLAYYHDRIAGAALAKIPGFLDEPD